MPCPIAVINRWGGRRIGGLFQQPRRHDPDRGGRRRHACRPVGPGRAAYQSTVRYPGTEVTADRYLDHEDYEGPLAAIFDGALAFVLRNLPKVQGSGKSVNLPGRPVVPRTVFEELLVNSLVHRDYVIQAPVRLFMLDDRVEITSPSNLPNHLTVEKIRAGNSVIRNPGLGVLRRQRRFAVPRTGNRHPPSAGGLAGGGPDRRSRRVHLYRDRAIDGRKKCTYNRPVGHRELNATSSSCTPTLEQCGRSRRRADARGRNREDDQRHVVTTGERSNDASNRDK